MNRIASPRRKAATNGHGHAKLPVAPADESLREQARALDETFKSLARRVLVDDDPAAELPLRQFRVCMALYDRPRSMTQLSRELGVSQSAITQIADRLEAARMVARSPAGDDRRVVSLQLTPRARKMLRLREEGRIARVMSILGRMPADTRETVSESLAALRDALSEDAS